MVCPKCQSSSISEVPAEIRLYRNRPRTLSHPPLSPYPDVMVCLDCGWAEFAIPEKWLKAGWLRQTSAPVATSGKIALVPKEPVHTPAPEPIMEIPNEPILAVM